MSLYILPLTATPEQQRFAVPSVRVAYWPALAVGGAAQLVATHCLNCWHSAAVQLMQFMIGCWHDIVLCLSVRLSVTLCIVAKRCVLQRKCLNKRIGSATRNTILQPWTPYTDPVPPLEPLRRWSHLVNKLWNFYVSGMHGWLLQH